MSKKKSFRYSRNAKKLRRKEKARLKIKNPIIDSAWKHGLSVKSNFNRLGIAYDPNEVLKISSRQFFKGTTDSIPKVQKKTKVVLALEEAAKHAKTKPTYQSEDNQLFCMYNMEVHGADFLAMSRDPKNVYQLTPKQLERLIGKFKKTPGYQQYLSQKETGTFSVADVYDISVA
ncbi:Nucleolar protein 16 [Clonorchis sinensis]|uniref:Nucleolar protein 16 n=1 Tax=Clonorchis sinensis TaxID=79923 RepID=A0A8T1MT70_CLOSI|nr:Nucleolar protein 16 [Clonorchis sinensis]